MLRKILVAILVCAALVLPRSAHAAALTLVTTCKGTGNTFTVCTGGGGIVNGDLLIGNVAGNAATLSAASWTFLRGFQPPSGEMGLVSYYRIASSEPVSYPITASDSKTAWSMRVYRNQNATWAFGTKGDGANGTGGGGTANGTPTTYSLTTGAPGEIYVGVIAWESGSGTDALTPPVALGNTNQTDAVASTNYGLFDGDLTPGSPGVVADQVGSFTPNSGHQYGISFTIVPNGWSQNFVAATKGTSSCAIPAGSTSGKFMVMCETGFNSNPTTPSGWTLQATINGNSDLAWSNLYTKVATGSDSTVTWSGVTAPGCAIATYSGISGVDTSATCTTTGFNSTLCANSPTLSPSTQNDLVVVCPGKGGNVFSFTVGTGGEATTYRSPDQYAVIPMVLREKQDWVNSVNMGVGLFDFPFVGSVTNTPYWSQPGTFNDTTISIALTPTSQPVWPTGGATAALPLWPFP